MEVTFIGGEAYLRDDWLQIVRAVRAAGMQCTITTGGRGMTAERAHAAAARRIAGVPASRSTEREATHDRLRGVTGSYRSALRGRRHPARGRHAGLREHADQHLSMPELPSVLETAIGLGAHAWQIQLTVAMGRAADAPEVLLQP